MDNKEYLEHLKKHDPIAYSEMTSNPTGANENYNIFLECILPIVMLIICFIIIIYMIFNSNC